jgi:hypothetical protein
MGGKIDELLTIARDTNGRLARLEQWAQDKEHRCNSHSEGLKEQGEKIRSLQDWRNVLTGAWVMISAAIGYLVHKK